MLHLDEDGLASEGCVCSWKIHGKIKRSMRVRSYHEVQYIDYSLERAPGWFTLIFELEIDERALKQLKQCRHLRF